MSQVKFILYASLVSVFLLLLFILKDITYLKLAAAVLIFCSLQLIRIIQTPKSIKH
jgi:hypothetical protein